MDLVKDRDAAHLEGLLKTLNPKAKIVRSSFGKVDLNLLLNTGNFDMTEAEQMPGWLHELQGNHVPETLEYNISSFVFRAQRPFHPERLEQLLDAGFEPSYGMLEKLLDSWKSRVIRAKGVVWVAGLEVSLLLNQAGSAKPRLELGSAWLHRGDMRQEIVFIGRNLKKDRLINHLEQALVTDTEFEEMAESMDLLMDEDGNSSEEDASSSSSEDDSSSSSSSSSSDTEGGSSCRQRQVQQQTAAQKKMVQDPIV